MSVSRLLVNLPSSLRNPCFRLTPDGLRRAEWIRIAQGGQVKSVDDDDLSLFEDDPATKPSASIPAYSRYSLITSCDYGSGVM
jgi:hypothetical protein